METNHIEQDDKKWDRSWTTDEIRKNSANWTLAGDVGLYNLLTEFSQTIISRTHEVENAVDSLMHKTKMANAKISNVINDFHMLSNLQFVENRVYDEEITESTPETKPAEKTKEQKEAEMLPKITKAVELGLHVLDQAFNKINVNEISDSEDEDLSSEGRTILEPKDPYEQRPLPYIIGSDEFQGNDYAGLQDLLEEDADYSAEVESSSSDSEESSTDEEEPIPFDDEPFSSGQTPNKPFNKKISDEYSSSDESELFGSEKDDNGFISDSSRDSRAKGDAVSQKANEEIKSEVPTKPTSIANLQSKLNLEKVLPTPKKPEKKESNDLFVDDEPSDDDSPFRKNSGLFRTDVRFNEDKDTFGNDLFGDLPKETPKAAEKPKPAPEKVKAASVPKKKDEPSLFGNDDDSDDDIFKTLVTSRKNTAVAKDPSINHQESVEKADSSSTTSSTPSSKHAGRSFNFLSAGGPSDSLFGDESDADDLFSSKKPQKTFGFDATETDDDDLFGFGKSKKTEVPSKDKKEIKADVEKDSSLFESSNVVDKHKKIGQPLPGLVTVKTQEQPEKSSTPSKSFMKMGQPLPGLVKKKDSIFEDSDSSVPEERPIPKLPPVKKRDSLFGDDDEDDDDIFSQAPKKLLSPGKSPSATNKPKEPEKENPKVQSSAKTEKKSPETSLFDTEDDDFGFSSIKNTKIEKKTPVPDLFGDEDDSEWVTEKKPSVPSQKDKISKDSSLFEDSDNFDLFNPKMKTSSKPAKTSILSDDSEEDSLFKTSVKKNTPVPSKKEELSISKEEQISIVPDQTKESISPKKTESIIVNKEDVESDIKADKDVPSKSLEPSISLQPESSDDLGVGFDAPVNTSNTLHAINKDRARISSKKRRPPTKKGRMAALESSSSEKELQPSDSELPKQPEPSKLSDTDDLFSSMSEASPEPKPTTHKAQEKKKMDLMSQLMSEAASSRVLKKTTPAPKPVEDEEDVDIFSEVLNKDRSKSRGFSFKEPIESKGTSEKEVPGSVDTEEGDNDDFFAEPSFKNFRNSVSHKNSILDLDDDDEDDLFSSIKSGPLKPKTKASESDIFDDDTDIFADLQKEKYEMFPSQLYDDEDDDIFSGLGQNASSGNASSSKTTNSVPAKKEAEKKPVFDDPLSGLLGDD